MRDELVIAADVGTFEHEGCSSNPQVMEASVCGRFLVAERDVEECVSHFSVSNVSLPSEKCVANKRTR